jgi:hypothetical protein
VRYFVPMMNWKKFFRAAISGAAILSSAPVFSGDFDYTGPIKRIVTDIANLKSSFPQLEDFSAAENLNASEIKISYGYHTHQPEQRGGWTSGVPNPDEDGIWFYIDFHDVDSTAEIHTQPVTASICIGDKKVSFLSLEGKHTKPVDGTIFQVLEKHGAKKCER